jgi:hypothetical protein
MVYYFIGLVLLIVNCLLIVVYNGTYAGWYKKLWTLFPAVLAYRLSLAVFDLNLLALIYRFAPLYAFFLTLGLTVVASCLTLTTLFMASFVTDSRRRKIIKN